MGLKTQGVPEPKVRTNRGVWLGLLAIAVTSCGLLEPDETLVPGIIQSYGSPLVFEAPDTVTAGVPFRAVVRTYGGGCISKGSVTVAIDGRIATLVPRDRQSDADFCTLELRFFSHEVDILFEGSGLGEIRVVGRVEPGDSIVVRKRAVWVR